ncbi:MAG TPA: DEAD/DEAH box helicase, partial [Vicinamibacteria bacterium]
MPGDVASVARERLGFAELRPGQEEAIRAVVGGRDTLVVMPTGAGKSACGGSTGPTCGSPRARSPARPRSAAPSW